MQLIFEMPNISKTTILGELESLECFKVKRSKNTAGVRGWKENKGAYTLTRGVTI